jgi:hypothetical protein
MPVSPSVSTLALSARASSHSPGQCVNSDALRRGPAPSCDNAARASVGARIRDRLEARSRIDGVAEDHALALRAQLDGTASRQHSGCRPQLGHPHLLAQGRQRLGQGEGCARRALSVVLASLGLPHTAMTA